LNSLAGTKCARPPGSHNSDECDAPYRMAALVPAVSIQHDLPRSILFRADEVIEHANLLQCISPVVVKPDLRTPAPVPRS
jgi:hypothetical protein